MSKAKKDWRDRFNDVVSDWERAAEVKMDAALYGAIEDFIDQALQAKEEEVVERILDQLIEHFEFAKNNEATFRKGIKDDYGKIIVKSEYEKVIGYLSSLKKGEKTI